jgi:arginyl-tRNA synthetase
MARSHVCQVVGQAVREVCGQCQEIPLSRPQNALMGHYTTNIAFTIGKNLKKSPLSVAQDIVAHIKPDAIISKVVAAAPGFLNITLRPEYLASQLPTFPDIHRSSLGKNILCEFTDPNPFKEFHIGHLYSNAVGESLSRIMEASGAHVHRVNYQGDVGMHVAVCIYGMIHMDETFSHLLGTAGVEDFSNILNSMQNTLSLSDRVRWLGKCYAFAAAQRKEHTRVQEDVKVLNAQVFVAAQTMWKKTDPNFSPVVDYQKYVMKEYIPQKIVNLLYETGRTWTLDYFEKIYGRLGTKFRYYFFESFVGEYGWALVHEFSTKGIFTKSDGAIVYPESISGLHTRVFINSLGLPTYEAKELGLAKSKLEYSQKVFHGKLDRSISITGNEISEYFKVVVNAMTHIYPDYVKIFTHLPHGMVRLPEGKMSSRTGNIVTADKLLDEVSRRIASLVDQSDRMTHEQKEEAVERLAIAAVKYAFLKSNIGGDITFNFEESLSIEGNTGPYLLYTIVRCASILEKAYEKQKPVSETCYHVKEDDPEVPLLSHLLHFSETVEKAGALLAPHVICTYAHELAAEFNSYYARVPVLTSHTDVWMFRIQVVEAIQKVLTKCCHLLGFETVRRM